MQTYDIEVPNVLSGSVIVGVRYTDHPSNGKGQYWIDSITEQPKDRRRKAISHVLDRRTIRGWTDMTYAQRYETMIRRWDELIGIEAINAAFQGAWQQMQPPMVTADMFGTMIIVQ